MSDAIFWTSPSRLATWARCHRAAFASRGETSANANFGTACHWLMELLLTTAITLEAIHRWHDDPEAAECVREYVERHGLPQGVISVEGDGLPSEYLHFEHGRRQARVQLAPDVGLKLIMDCVSYAGADCLVIDWKSGPVDRMDAAPQATSNLVAAARIWPGSPRYVFRAVELRTGNYEEWMLAEADIPAETDCLVQKIRELRDSDDRTERINKYCGYCGDLARCETGRALVPVTAPDDITPRLPWAASDVGDAMEKLKYVKAAAALVEQAKGDLERQRDEWLSVGPVECRGWRYERREIPNRYDYDEGAVMQAVIDAGLEPREFVKVKSSIDTKAINKLDKTEPELARKIKAMRTVSSYRVDVRAEECAVLDVTPQLAEPEPE